MTKLHINETPLQIFPTLARKIGLNEAIVLQQIHYWLHFHRDNQHRVYNASEQWQKQFPFWSRDTIKHTIISLKRQNLITDAKLSQKNSRQCQGYTINYQALECITACNNRTGQIDTIEETLLTSDHNKMTRSIITICPTADGHEEYFYES